MCAAAKLPAPGPVTCFPQASHHIPEAPTQLPSPFLMRGGGEPGGGGRCGGGRASEIPLLDSCPPSTPHPSRLGSLAWGACFLPAQVTPGAQPGAPRGDERAGWLLLPDAAGSLVGLPGRSYVGSRSVE